MFNEFSSPLLEPIFTHVHKSPPPNYLQYPVSTEITDRSPIQTQASILDQKSQLLSSLVLRS